MSRPRGTQCAQGHEMTEANSLYSYRNGRQSRRCRTCHNDHDRIAKRLKRAVEKVKRPANDGIIDEVALKRAAEGDLDVLRRLTLEELDELRRRGAA